MLNKQPFFSIVIPTKNRAWAIKDTLTSVIIQSYENFEVVVVDNNDEDDATYIQVAQFKDERICYVKTGSLSMGKNWSAGIRRARGKYILITADKTLLKQDALLMLHAYINLYPEVNVFTYEYDSYYDNENAYLSRIFEREPKIITSKYLLGLILKSKFDEFSHYAGRGYNSCFSGDVIRKIFKERGDPCTFYNPDYSIAYHFMLDNHDMLYLPISPLLARQISFKNAGQGYGNGNSYFYKTDTFKTYLDDCVADLGVGFELVPIKKFLVYSVLINDFLMVAKKWNSKFLIDKPAYYRLNYKETLSRKSYMVDVRDELSEFWHALNMESFELRISIYIKIFPLYIKSFFYPLYRFLQRFDHFLMIVRVIKRAPEEVDYIYCDDVIDCVKKSACPIPINLNKIDQKN